MEIWSKLKALALFNALARTETSMLTIVPIRNTWTPKVGKLMAFMAVIMGSGLLFYILLGV